MKNEPLSNISEKDAQSCNVPIEHTTNNKQKANKLRGLSPRENYTDRETAACR
jgi:hypothetical protein